MRVLRNFLATTRCRLDWLPGTAMRACTTTHPSKVLTRHGRRPGRHTPRATALDDTAPSTSGRADSDSDANDVDANARYIQQCQTHYSIPTLVDFISGPNGQPFVALRHPSGASAQVCLHGATVTSWKRADGSETLYLRGTNRWDGKDPVAGGIGVAWPQLGPGVLPLHGLLRNVHWSVVETAAYEDTEDPRPSVSFHADSTDLANVSAWPHKFEALYTVSLEHPDPPELHPREMAELEDRLVRGEKFEMPPPPPPPAEGYPSVLRCVLEIYNSGDGDMEFSTGLLTHFATEDLRENRKTVKILGLNGKYVLDYSADPMRPRMSIEQEDFVFFDPDSGINMNKLYVECKDDGQILFCPGSRHYFDIRHLEGFCDMEVLHPAAAAPDVARQCVCLASARKALPMTLKPGEAWKGEITIAAHNDYWPLPPFEKANPVTVPVPNKSQALPPRGERGSYGEES